MSLLPSFQWVNEINIQCQPLHLCTHRTLLLCSDSTTVPFPLSKFSLPPRSFLLAHKDAMCCAKLPQSCPTLCKSMDHSPPGSSVHGILQARILEWVALLSSRGSTNPGIEPTSLMYPALAGGFVTTSTTWEAPKDSNSYLMELQ